MSEEYARIEPFKRSLECEYRENPNPPTGDLEPCDLEAEYTVSSPMWSDETRTRYCSIHIWNELERQLDKFKEGEQNE